MCAAARAPQAIRSGGPGASTIYAHPSLPDTPYVYSVYLTGRGVFTPTPLPVRHAIQTQRVSYGRGACVHRNRHTGAGKGLRYFGFLAVSEACSLYDLRYTLCACGVS